MPSSFASAHGDPGSPKATRHLRSLLSCCCVGIFSDANGSSDEPLRECAPKSRPLDHAWSAPDRVVSLSSRPLWAQLSAARIGIGSCPQAGAPGGPKSHPGYPKSRHVGSQISSPVGVSAPKFNHGTSQVSSRSIPNPLTFLVPSLCRIAKIRHIKYVFKHPQTCLLKAFKAACVGRELKMHAFKSEATQAREKLTARGYH